MNYAIDMNTHPGHHRCVESTVTHDEPRGKHVVCFGVSLIRYQHLFSIQRQKITTFQLQLSQLENRYQLLSNRYTRIAFSEVTNLEQHERMNPAKQVWLIFHLKIKKGK